MKKYGFGVDIGGTACKIGLFLTEGVLVDKWEIKTNVEKDGKFILDDIAESLKNMMSEKMLTADEIQGIGVGVPGPVIDNGVVFHCVNLGWKDYPVAKILSEKMNIDVKVANDANIAAVGEMWQGGGKGYKNVVMVTLGTGVGGGIIVNEHILSGTNGAGGEIGHMTVNSLEEKPCNCGRTGCLEQYVSATGIVRMAKEGLLKEHQISILDDCEDITAKTIFDAAKEGDCFANKLMDSFGNILGNALSNIAILADPEIFVIGGGVSKAGQMLIDIIEKYYQKAVFSACKNTKFALASLGNDAGIYGGVKLVLHSNEA